MFCLLHTYSIPFEVKLDHHNPITDTDTDDDMKALPAFTLNNGIMYMYNYNITSIHKYNIGT